MCAVIKNPCRAAASGKEPQAQGFKWLTAIDGTAAKCLKHLGAKIPEGLDTDMLYRIMMLWRPETISLCYETDMTLTEQTKELLKMMQPEGADYDRVLLWLIIAGCYFGYLAMIDAMLACYKRTKSSEQPGKFLEVLQEKLQQHPDNVERTDLPEMIQKQNYASREEALATFDAVRKLAKAGVEFQVEVNMFGWCNGMNQVCC